MHRNGTVRINALAMVLFYLCDMKKGNFISRFIVVICLLKGFVLDGQVNLVPNPGFETITSCVPIAGGVNIGYLPPWDSPSDGTPDADNTCNPISSCSVPYNGWGFQHPHSGNGYVGLGFYAFSSGQDAKEYLQVKLDSTLIAQHVYCASFFISLANSTKIACNNAGIYFSLTHTYVTNSTTLNFVPQINDTNIISDTAGWTMISGQYTAGGGEKYIVIGNFFSNALTDTIHTNGGNSANYYYLDDVSVIDCTPGLGVGELQENSITLYPNPATNKLTIDIKNTKPETIKVINMLGQTLEQQEVKTNQPNGNRYKYPAQRDIFY